MGWRAERPLPYHWIYFFEACAVSRWMHEFGAQHLHAHFGNNPAEVAMLAGVLAGKPYSFTAHGTVETDHPKFIGLGEKIRRAAFVIAVSAFGRSQLYRCVDESHWGRIRLIHCGLPPDYFESPEVPTAHMQRLVCVGRLSPEKGHYVLLCALRELLERGHACELVLAGDGEMRSDLEVGIDRLGLRSNVTITGWLSGDAVRQELLAARALVLPSFAEGLPVVIMEAMALRRPVISTYVGGIPELVIHGETGWLVPAGCTRQLADRMAECLGATDEQLAAMGNAGWERVYQRHSIEEGAKRLAECFFGQQEGRTES
jgi:glycosyltransferase involved in cell wall biosynthesis